MITTELMKHSNKGEVFFMKFHKTPPPRVQKQGNNTPEKKLPVIPDKRAIKKNSRQLTARYVGAKD
jgi:hypothetical protein